jgi:hypothetical protein
MPTTRELAEVLSQAATRLSIDRGALYLACSEVRRMLERSREDAELAVAALEPSCRVAAQPEIEALRSAMQAQAELLAQIQQALADRQRSQYAALGEKLRGSERALEHAWAELREAALLALGPSGLPGINQITHSIDRALSGGCPRSVLHTQIECERLLWAQLLALDVGTDLRERMAQMHEALSSLAPRLRDANAAALRRARDVLIDLAHGVEEAGFMEYFCTTTHSAQFNELIATAFAVLRQQTPPAALTGAAEEMVVLVRYCRAQSSQGEVTSARASELAARVDGLYAACEPAICGLVEAVQTGNRCAVSRMVRSLHQLADQLAAVRHEVEQLQAREGGSTCLRCSTANAPGRRHCAHCGGVLPATHAETGAQLHVLEG